MTQPLSYIRILTNNFKEMFNFYNDILGLQLKFGTAEDAYVEFETGTTDIAIFKQDLMEKAIGTKLDRVRKNAHIMIIFPVMNVDEKYEEMKAKGVDFIKPPITHEDWDVRTAQFFDPDGNLIEINTRLDNLDSEGFYN